jgi:hypothetical protein
MAAVNKTLGAKKMSFLSPRENLSLTKKKVAISVTARQKSALPNLKLSTKEVKEFCDEVIDIGDVNE